MFLDFIGRPLDAIKHKLDIRASSDIEGTIQNIDDNIEIKGYNIWILVCAAVLASIGLDTNSTAVIIGFRDKYFIFSVYSLWRYYT